ncbi:MAG: GNAT family N-acetyltransferase [Planctomycetota bacterium]|jgi:ribosomal protein S18 acetylase RimI-like enzyme
MLKIYQVETDEDIEVTRSLLGEYFARREFEESIFPEEVQAFQKQLSELPAEFAPPKGCLFLAMYGDQPAGCVGLRDLGDGISEMKRLYVKPEFRGFKIGRKLVEAVIEQAQNIIGYKQMRLDTIPSMIAARTLYVSIGFEEIEPYRYNPIEGAQFMELKLSKFSG